MEEFSLKTNENVLELFEKLYSPEEVAKQTLASQGLPPPPPSSTFSLSVTKLGSYCDLNFKITLTSSSSSVNVVFKFIPVNSWSGSNGAQGLIDHTLLQRETMSHLLPSLPFSSSPLLLPQKRTEGEKGGEEKERDFVYKFMEQGGGEGAEKVCYLVTFLEGRLLDNYKLEGKEGIECVYQMGKFFGHIDASLSSFTPPHWKVDCPEWGCSKMYKTVKNVLKQNEKLFPEYISLMQPYVELYESEVKDYFNSLPHSLIHNDFNEQNIIVKKAATTESGESVFDFGIFDFGDMSYTATIGEIAVAASYVGQLCPIDPLRYITPLLAGYHYTFPLTEKEVDVFFPFLCLRLCMTIIMGISATKENESNREYLMKSVKPAADVLKYFSDFHPRFFTYLFRQQCFGETSPGAISLARSLILHRHKFGLVLDQNYRKKNNVVVFDFGVGGGDGEEGEREEGDEGEEGEEVEEEVVVVGEEEERERERVEGERRERELGEEEKKHQADMIEWSKWLFGEMEKNNAEVGVGRYMEKRGLYEGDQYGAQEAEKRTVHLGIDLFVKEGNRVRVPYDGVVYSFKDNDIAYDYGPCIIVKHELEGVSFYSLFGHLSLSSLEGLFVGKKVKKGDVIGRVGGVHVNGYWPPHLHYQIIFDTFDNQTKGNYIGVCELSRAPVFRSLCPDPNYILQIPYSSFLSLTSRSRPSPFPTPSPLPLPPLSPLPPSPLPLLPPSLFSTHHHRPSKREERERRRGGGGRVEEKVKERNEYLPLCYSLSYSPSPISVVSAKGCYMYDNQGKSYLDLVNNICHVGHSNDSVVSSLSSQAQELNTNTRFLYPSLLSLSKSLTSTFPSPLQTVFFVCSGSEANELAIRLARAYIHKKDIMVLEGGYHGNTNTLVGVSPYKFLRKGGSGPPPHVHVLDIPDCYRGKHRDDDKEKAGEKYAEDIRNYLQKAKKEEKEEEKKRVSNGQMMLEEGVGCFLSETMMGCGGQIELPPGYLKAVYSTVREAGGVCIADEVQVGFGRVGSHMWAFETQDVVPDIVVLGKPMGNGHPLAAVVTRPEIAQAFTNGMEFFNSFGGNPVSCVVGEAVLYEIKTKKLQKNALEVGNFFLNSLLSLKNKHKVIGDVRGRGLFIGVDLVEDRETRKPATELAKKVVDEMKQRGVLISRDGPCDNVLKIKPPIVLSYSDVQRAVHLLDSCLTLFS